MRRCENLCFAGGMNNPSTTKFHILSHPISAPHAAPNGPAAAPEPAAGSVHEPSGPAAGGGARRGRPTVFSDKVFAMMKDYARRLGFSDSAAAEGVGVSSSTISRWKKENPEMAHELQTARQECRIHHLERIMQFAEGDDNRGLRASMWLLERLFPGDYAPRMSERFACRNFEDRAREREEEALQREREAEAKAERAAEAQAKYLEMMAAYEAEIAQHAAAAPRTESDSPAEAGDAAPASGSDSHNSRNSGEAEPDRGPHTPCAASPDRTEDCADHGEPLNKRPLPTVRPGSVNEAAPAELSFTASESGSHNSRNSSSSLVPEGPHAGGSVIF